jgi:hypothetical protein
MSFDRSSADKCALFLLRMNMNMSQVSGVPYYISKISLRKSWARPWLLQNKTITGDVSWIGPYGAALCVYSMLGLKPIEPFLCLVLWEAHILLRSNGNLPIDMYICWYLVSKRSFEKPPCLF